MKHDKPIRRVLFPLLGILCSVGCPVAATLFYFPIWEGNSGKMLCGGTLILLLFSAVPLFRMIKERLKTPAAWMLWLLTFLLFSCLSQIAAEMTVISFFGLCGNLAGAVFFRLGRRKEGTDGERQV